MPWVIEGIGRGKDEDEVLFSRNHRGKWTEKCICSICVQFGWAVERLEKADNLVRR